MTGPSRGTCAYPPPDDVHFVKDHLSFGYPKGCTHAWAVYRPKSAFTPPKAAKAAAPLLPKAKSTRAKKDTEKAKAAKKPSKKKAVSEVSDDEADDAGDEGEGDEGDEGEAKGGRDGTVQWSNELSQQLISSIVGKAIIKRVLFPPPGANASTAKGGGKTKVSAHWDLCVELFGDDPKYNDVIEEAKKLPKQQVLWARKIKARIKTMSRLTRDYVTEMGQTGAGIKRAADINITKINSFTTKWEEISASCPWFFDMRELIAQRPNLVPVGLGHSATGFDQDVMQLAPRSDAATSEAPDVTSDIVTNDKADQNEQDEDHTKFPASIAAANDDPKSDVDELSTEEDEPTVNLKKLVAKKVQNAPKKSANPGASISRHAPVTAPTPASSSVQKLSKKTKLVEFADIAKNEELTRRQEIELATIRARQSLKALEVKGRIAEQREKRHREEKQGRRAERQMKLQMRQKRLDQLHELRMAQMGMGAGAVASGSGSHTHAASLFDARDSTTGFSSSEYAGSDNFGDMDTFSHDMSPSTTVNTSFPTYTLPSYDNNSF
ncbi:hypothetical protein C8F04DRAFT_1183482 [Mycena alexandri]|uniref:Uncharacterized protein n=1 Tax=Mycena alexandri TaxID=1745969 RepID=A0AAD6SW86_9AGAR|nr:hypothetical protein C8F04DRAFT_1183482 [Mycena alexandri]